MRYIIYTTGSKDLVAKCSKQEVSCRRLHFTSDVDLILSWWKIGYFELVYSIEKYKGVKVVLEDVQHETTPGCRMFPCMLADRCISELLFVLQLQTDSSQNKTPDTSHSLRLEHI